jgi:hypothetical protein
LSISTEGQVLSEIQFLELDFNSCAVLKGGNKDMEVVVLPPRNGKKEHFGVTMAKPLWSHAHREKKTTTKDFHSLH